MSVPARSKFDPVLWSAALNLRERAALFRKHQASLDASAFDAEKSKNHLAKWLKQKPFDTDGALEERLAIDDMDLKLFKTILGLDPKFLAACEKTTPPWLQTLAEAFQTITGNPFSQERLKASPGLGFCYATKPISDYFTAQLEAYLKTLKATCSALPLDAETGVRLFLEPLYFLLMRTMNKVLILELNVERLKGNLVGDSSALRFASFTEKLQDRSYSLDILLEYPVLARRAMGIGKRWLDANREFLDRLNGDWPEIVQTFFAGKDPGTVVQVQDSGDRHCNGRTVAILTFESGEKLVYKPRDLGIDQHFFTILKWLDGECDWGFEPLKVLNRGTYGWVEFVTQSPCETKAQVARFYKRLGGLLALLYVLEASDFHYENLIAAGDMPQLIDLESFFTPYLASKDESWMSVMSKSMVDSVLQTGLLPWRVFLGKEDKEGLDISGVTNVKGEKSSQYAAYWANEGADDMHLAFRKHDLEEGKNRPTLKGMEISLLAYDDSFVEGFEAVYTLLQENREALLAQGGLIEAFNFENRVLTRMTLGYSYLLNQSYHPDVSRDAIDLDRHWDGLWMGLERQPLIPKFFKGERDALFNLDIPVFTNHPKQKDLLWPGGKEIDFFKGTSMQRVLKKIARLSEEDLRTQIWFIRGSLATLRAEHAEEITYTLDEHASPATHEDLMAGVFAVADHLEAQVKEQGGESSWINLCLLGESGYHLQPMGIDLYSGLPGLLLFYAYLGKVTGEENYTERAKSIGRGLTSYLGILRRRHADVREGPDYGTGMFQGYGGVIYALTHTASLWSDEAMFAVIDELLDWIEPLIAVDEKSDIISGSSGLLISLLTLYQQNPNPNLRALAIKCGDRLLEQAHRDRGGLCWKGTSGKALTGFSHGGAGMGYALYLLSHLSGENRFAKAAHLALVFERSHFLAAEGNWADLREFDTHLLEPKDGEQRLMCAWCNGASGVGMSRLLMKDLVKDPELDRELTIAVATTLKSGFGRSHCLCHGDVGNLVFLHKVAEQPNNTELKRQIATLAGGILASIKQHGWICGVPNHFEALGLMTGVTGIGYGLMRLAHPEIVPSIVFLEPPIHKSSKQHVVKPPGMCKVS